MAAGGGRNQSDRSKPRTTEREAAATPHDLSICDYQKAFTRSIHPKKKKACIDLETLFNRAKRGQRIERKGEGRRRERGSL